MDPETLLNNMAPLRQPEAISWWPPAIGWWIVAGLIALALVLISLGLWRRYKAAHYRRIALKNLEQQAVTGDITVSAVNRLLKVVALQCWPKHEVADLSGKAWTEFLASSTQKACANGSFEELQTIYQAPDKPATQTLLDATRYWIAKHRRDHD